MSHKISTTSQNNQTNSSGFFNRQNAITSSSSGLFNQQITTTSSNSGLFNKLNLGLRRLFKLPLDFYSCMVSSGKLSLRRSRTPGLSFAKESPTKKTLSFNLGTKVNSVSKLSHKSLGHKSLFFSGYIYSTKLIRASAVLAIFSLVILTSATLIPLYNNISITEAATDTAKESSLSLNVTNSTASVDLGVVKDNGSFASSTNPIAFNVTTTNYTGYTLSIKNSKTTTDLVNATANGSYTSDSNKYATLSSIPSATSSSTFSADDVNTGNNYNGKYGLLYSKLNSTTNTSYQPSPTSTTATTLDKTTVANSSANTYTIGLGARASYTQPAGTYTGTYTLTAVGNAITYYLSFTDNTSDSTVSGLPNAMSSSISTTSVTLPTTTPTRTGYTFKSWCLGTVSNSGTTCTGTEYAKGASFGMDQTSSNGTSTTPVTLYAVWTVNSYTQTVEYYCQSATGAASSKYTYTLNVNYGSTFTFTSSNATSCYNSTYHSSTIYTTNNGTTSKTISYKVTGTTTNTAYFNRNTRTVTLTKGTGISTVSVTGTGVKSGSGTASATVYYGGAVIIAATMTSGYDWVNWTGSATYTSQSQSISSVTSNLSFTGNGKNAKIYIQDLTSDNCQKNVGANGNIANVGDSITVYDRRDENEYTVRHINGNCWMTSNLRIASGATLTSEYSNVAANYSYTIPSAELASGVSYTEGRVHSGIDSDNNQAMWYNYCAASAGSICVTANRNAAPMDICPKGWGLPYQHQNATIGGIGQGNGTYASVFNLPQSGYYENNGAFYNIGYSAWWSATAYSTSTSRYMLSTQNGYMYAGDSNDRTAGYYVRCVLR